MNSREKAEYIYKNYQVDFFADDTGLEVEALNGAPGVYSARYAGPAKDNEENIKLLLENLKDHPNKNARFRTVITLILQGKQIQFEGIVNGQIIEKKRGSHGFGYDPVFIPQDYNKTFAEMTLAEKSAISHRGKAVEKLVQYLKSIR